MMSLPDPTEAAADAEAAAMAARALRERLRRKVSRTDSQREDDIVKALEDIRLAMIPVRQWIGKLAWEPQPQPVDFALREASARCQYERRQLKKMQYR